MPTTIEIPSVEELLQRVGLNTDSLSRLKLGRGVAGNMTTIGVVALICLAVVAYPLALWPAKLGAIGAIAVLALYLLYRLEKLAREKPDVALLEGAEFLLYHQKRLGLGAKGGVRVSVGPVEPYQAPLPPSAPPIEEVEVSEK